MFRRIKGNATCQVQCNHMFWCNVELARVPRNIMPWKFYFDIYLQNIEHIWTFYHSTSYDVKVSFLFNICIPQLKTHLNIFVIWKMFACNNGSFPLLLRLLNYTKMIHRQIDPRHTPISVKYTVMIWHAICFCSKYCTVKYL